MFLQIPDISLALAGSVVCDKLKSVPAIELSTSYGKLKYDYTKSNKQLTKLASKHGIAEKGLFASGLATVNVSWEISVNTTGKVYDEDNICIVPTSLKVFIGFSEPTIYISKQLRKKSCEYNVVVRHEQTHQQINKTTLDYFIPLFEDALEKIAANVKPERVNHISDIDHGTSVLTQKYNKKLAPLIEIFKKELMIEQSKLDNKANYEYENNLCKN